MSEPKPNVGGRGEPPGPPCGRVFVQVRDVDAGIVVAERRARNIVLRQGASIVAGLFAGAPDARAIDQIQVGFGTESAGADATALTAPAAERNIDPAALRSPVTREQFTIATDKPGIIQVSIAAVFRPTVVLADVSEAGLLAAGRLYNQVVFEPVTLQPGQDVTFFWEIDFPFGR